MASIYDNLGTYDIRRVVGACPGTVHMGDCTARLTYVEHADKYNK